MRVYSRSLRSAGPAVALAAALGAAPLAASAQQYPSQDIRVIAAFPAGSGADVLVRYFAEKLRPIVKRTVIVENKAGAQGNLAVEFVARSKPDGYTIFVHAATAVAASQHLFKKPPVEVGKAIQIAATINRQPFMLVVDAKSPYKTVADLTEAMKKKGAKATYATAAPTGKIMGEIYKDAMKLRRYLSDRGRIESRRKTGTCAKHQRWLAVALKRARHLALLPYSPEHIRALGAPVGRR